MASTAQLESLAAAIGYAFKNQSLLQQALVHPASLSRKARGTGPVPYERLEFLGDRVLNLAMASWLYEIHPDAAEGGLARQHAGLVQRETLAAVGQTLGLLDLLTLAPGDRENTRGHPTLLGDAVEALLGAVYLDAGFGVAETVVRRLLAEAVAAQGSAPREPKTALQEWAQARGLPLPAYIIVAQSGPSHAPTFTVELTVSKHAPMQATGTSKQEAEKAAAALLLKQIADKT